MKLSPLLLFLLIVFILVISVVVSKSFDYPLEGFVSYKVNVIPSTNDTIRQYSSYPVVKMFDNMFFDNKNGNVIEVDSSKFLGNLNADGNYVSGNIDTAGDSITNLYISTREGTLRTYQIPTSDISESKISRVNRSYKKWVYNTKCKNTGNYQLFYVPWNTDTYVHIVEKKSDTPQYHYGSRYNPSNVYTYKFSGESSAVSVVRHTDSPLPVNLASTLSEPGINTFVNDPYYHSSRKVYKLSSAFSFDASNGNLILRTPTSITVYDRSKKISAKSNTPLQNANLSNTISSVDYTVWIVNDENNASQLVYVANSTKTLLLIIDKNNSDSYDSYNLSNVAHFTSNGLDNDGREGPPPASGTARDRTNNPTSDYYQWYLNSIAKSNGHDYFDKYILKTQIVPPVCPICPQCTQKSDICTNCGGKGGSGTLKNESGNAATTPALGAGAAIGGTALGAGAAIGGTALGAGAAIGGIAQGTGSAVGSVASGISGIANNAISTTGSIANNLINSSNKTNVSQGAGSQGTGSQGTGSQGTGSQAPGFSQGNPPIDNYSYYGALPSKSGNYIPITADFSRFGK